MKRIKQFKDFKFISESQHGNIIIYGKNENEPKQKLGYAKTIEAAEDIEDEFRGDFDDVWYDNEDDI